jgi:uncharacterized protein YcbX
MNDRRWRLIDTEGRVVNAKRTDRFHSIRAQFEGMDDDSTRLSQSPSGHFVTLWIDHELAETSGNSQSAETFPLIPGSKGPCEWLSDALEEHVFLEERVEGGFPDDRDAAGPTVISTETLSEVARWFGWDDAEARRRFRMNLELTAESDQCLQMNVRTQNCFMMLSGKIVWPVHVQKMASVSVPLMRR